MNLWRLKHYLSTSSLICRFGWHGVIYADHSRAKQPEPGVFLGPIRRYCGRCGWAELADAPEMWDRVKNDDPAFALPEVVYYTADGEYLQTVEFAGAGIP